MDDHSTLVGRALSEFEDVIQRFEHAWQGTTRPDILAYLPAASGFASLLTELIHVDLEYRLRAGESARVEEYLTRFPELANDRVAALNLIAAEFELRVRDEPWLVAAEYLHRFPRYAEELVQKFEAAITRDGRGGNVSDRAPDARSDEFPAVPGYEVVRPIGRGGMGLVYAARQLSLNRLVALKFLPEVCSRDPVWLERFRREALVASALNHPNICTIHDSGMCAGRPFLSMELVDGQTLAEWTGKRASLNELVRMIGQAARALAAAHAAGIVHRDIKPQNLMARADGIVKVLDFGLARRLPDYGRADASADTDPGTRIGTVRYMSPEQTRGEPVDSASDIFSLGIVCYELATGQHPFASLTDAGIAQFIVEQYPVPIPRLNPEMPSPLDDLVQQMMAKDPRQRPTAAEVDAALVNLIDTAAEPAGRQPDDAPHPVTVGREAERATLRAGAASATAGHGVMLCVTGEPGLGKTTLVEEFLAELEAADRSCIIARGRCSERLAGTEAYLPVLEALDSLIQGPGGVAATQLMKIVAPTWYLQLVPMAADDPALSRVLEEARGASQERRKRELSVFLHEVSRRHALVLFLDDVHWADPSSVDLLAYLGAKCASMPLLIVVSYRPSDLLRSRHPFGPVKLDLQGRGVCREIALPFLNRNDFDHYLSLAFAGHQFPEELADALHARTEGHPLFMVDLLRYLRDSGVIIQADGRWELVRDVADFTRELPESVRSMVQRKLDQLAETDRHLLMAASVQGPEFDSAVVARVLGQEAADVEERLHVLERVDCLVRLVRELALPDGTLTVRYRFVHVLYQNALYVALQPTRKAAWSAAAAHALLDHYGAASAGLAAELAMLFEAAHDRERAADHYRVAADNAARLFGHYEAVALAQRGLALLETLPVSPDRARRELHLQVILGVQLQVIRGYASPDAERTYDRARILCEQVQDATELFPVLWGLWMLHLVRSNLRKSQELAEQLFTLAQQDQDHDNRPAARLALTVTALSYGDPGATREHAELGMDGYDPRQHSDRIHIYGQDPGVSCMAFGAVALWLLGYPDRALQQSRQAVALAGELRHPTTLALVLYYAAMLQHYRREAPAARASAEAVTNVANEHGLSLWLAIGRIMEGWALAEQGAVGASAALRAGLAAFLDTGAEVYRTYFFGLLAEALGREGHVDEGLRVLAEALDVMDNSGEAFHGAELHRLRGEFLLQQGATDERCHAAEACFREALLIAARQRARSLELRAAMSLTRLYQKLGRQEEARPILAECYGWFSEGFATPDLTEARALLQQIS